MLTTCFTYAEAVGIKQKGRASEEDLEIAFRTELAKVCETHEDRILNKYELGKDEYSASFEEHRKNPRIQQEQAEILDMMERAIKGRHPDLTVPPQVPLASHRPPNLQPASTSSQSTSKCARNWPSASGRN